MTRAAWLLVVAGAIALPGAASAHLQRPETVIAAIGKVQSRAAHGVVSVARDAHVQRLLIVRVGPAWDALPADTRRTLAEAWHHDWRAAVPDGIVGVVDATSGHAVMNFDAHGRARVARPGPPPDQEAGSRNSLKP